MGETSHVTQAPQVPRLTRREFLLKMRDVGKRAVGSYALYALFPPSLASSLNKYFPDPQDFPEGRGRKPLKVKENIIDGKLFVADPPGLEVLPSVIEACRIAKISLSEPGKEKVISQIIIMDQNNPKFPKRPDNCLKGQSCYGPQVEKEKPFAICTFDKTSGKAIIYIANSPQISTYQLYHEEGHGLDPGLSPACFKEVLMNGQLPKQVEEYNADFEKGFKTVVVDNWLTYDPDSMIRNDPYLSDIFLGRATALGQLYPSLYEGSNPYNRDMLTGLQLLKKFASDPKKFADDPAYKIARESVEQTLTEIHDILRVEQWAQIYAMSKMFPDQAAQLSQTAIRAQNEVVRTIAIPG